MSMLADILAAGRDYKTAIDASSKLRCVCGTLQNEMQCPRCNASRTAKIQFEANIRDVFWPDDSVRGTHSVICYFAAEADRIEFIEAVKTEMPHIRTIKV